MPIKKATKTATTATPKTTKTAAAKTTKKAATRATKTAATKTAAAKTAAAKTAAVPQVSPQGRWQQIQTAAYLRAESRNFAPGFEVEDWLVAETLVDAQLQAAH